MSRNRRKVDGEMTLAGVATHLLLFVLLVSFLLGITFLKRRNLKMGDELGRLDHELKLAVEKTESLRAQLSLYKTPRELESKMARWHISMSRPSESQIRRLPEPNFQAVRNDRNRPPIVAQNDRLH